MTLSDISSIVGVISGLAVLGSLFYLSLQNPQAQQMPKLTYAFSPTGLASLALVIFFLGALEPILALAEGASAAPSNPPFAAVPQKKRDQCGEYYPADMVSAHIGGEVFLSVHISPDGTLSDATIARSSGVPSLDAAAVKCVTGAVWVPVRRGGVPIEVDWQVRVMWSALYPSYISTPAVGGESCAGYFPDLARRKQEQGRVFFIYQIAEDGSVRNVVVTQSSGYDDLDGAAIACASHWRFAVASQNGKPVQLDRSAGVAFSIH